MSKLTLVIADGHPIVREGLKAVFASERDLEVLEEACNGDQALEAIIRLKPRILLMDSDMPGCSWQQLLKRVSRILPSIAVVILSVQKEEHYAIPALRAGARGFINKARSPHELLAAIRHVAQGGVYLSRELAQRMALESLGGQLTGALHEQLTAREHEVFLKLVHGHSVSMISTHLHLSPKTISTHKKNILHKLGLDNISALVRYAIEQKLV